MEIQNICFLILIMMKITSFDLQLVVLPGLSSSVAEKFLMIEFG